MSNYQKLDAWKFSMELVKEIYQLVKCYPKEEIYSLVSQTKRAAISVPTNIAEGIGRETRKDTIRFLYISRGSIYELETLLNIALMTGIIENGKFQGVMNSVKKVFRVLNGLINYYQEAELK